MSKQRKWIHSFLVVLIPVVSFVIVECSCKLIKSPREENSNTSSVQSAALKRPELSGHINSNNCCYSLLTVCSRSSTPKMHPCRVSGTLVILIATTIGKANRMYIGALNYVLLLWAIKSDFQLTIILLLVTLSSPGALQLSWASAIRAAGGGGPITTGDTRWGWQDCQLRVHHTVCPHLRSRLCHFNGWQQCAGGAGVSQRVFHEPIQLWTEYKWVQKSLLMCNTIPLQQYTPEDGITRVNEVVDNDDYVPSGCIVKVSKLPHSPPYRIPCGRPRVLRRG